MATKRTTTRRPAKAPAPVPCPDCTTGQVSETFQVGGRKKRIATDHQEALCLTCFGTGHAPTS
ncbi:hypothetical protein [Streptomyces sp. NBC_00648]|uniref:hypothetical protein n=1 Tax=Streptomyces sp. NBC_00648 TaxID=2975797 RepID=UPI00324B9EFE